LTGCGNALYNWCGRRCTITSPINESVDNNFEATERCSGSWASKLSPPVLQMVRHLHPLVNDNVDDKLKIKRTDEKPRPQIQQRRRHVNTFVDTSPLSTMELTAKIFYARLARQYVASTSSLEFKRP
jgi:hypothetical protein